MKKIVLAMAAALMMTASAMAQDNQNDERKRPTQEQMIQHRTDDMVKRYSLNEEQAAKLLELNKKYTQMMPRRHGARPGRPDGKQAQQAPEEMKMPAAQDKGNRKARFEEMRKRMEEYDAQLQTILTPEQYKSYKADREKMRQRGPRGGNRPTQK